MIIGLGTDLVDIRRIEEALERFGERFIQRCFTAVEQAKCERRKGAGVKTYAGSYAKRFAAKEAFSKAVGTGFYAGVYMRDIGVVNLPSGKPTLALSGGAALRLEQMLKGRTAHIELALTDEYPLAQATVMIQALPHE